MTHRQTLRAIAAKIIHARVRLCLTYCYVLVTVARARLCVRVLLCFDIGLPLKSVCVCVYESYVKCGSATKPQKISS
jgi:hypothetical protein